MVIAITPYFPTFSTTGEKNVHGQPTGGTDDGERWNKIITTFENQRATCQLISKILGRLSVVRKAIVFIDFKTSKDSIVEKKKLDLRSA